MFLRKLVILVTMIISSKCLLAQQRDISTKTGNHISIRITGELAKEYARLTDNSGYGRAHRGGF